MRIYLFTKDVNLKSVAGCLKIGRNYSESTDWRDSIHGTSCPGASDSTLGSNRRFWFCKKDENLAWHEKRAEESKLIVVGREEKVNEWTNPPELSAYHFCQHVRRHCDYLTGSVLPICGWEVCSKWTQAAKPAPLPRSHLLSPTRPVWCTLAVAPIPPTAFNFFHTIFE